ncbi:hypothetical protein [uncultured Streptomyces sp.]|uniref:hypothetical protein n=1 Tax=uncultured Streptomyces sp. TaxID=174707 RepID=UPI0026191806|nr:hypothetical protein [uncultured Streptomyces sp.]
MGTLTSLFGTGAPVAPSGSTGGADTFDAGSETDFEAADGDGLDEVALRRMLRGAVADLEPPAGTLAHLQRAVPARRARKRQAVVGVAAAVLLFGTAVPAFVHVANSGTSSSALPSLAGHGERPPVKDGGGATGAESGSGHVGSPATGKGADGEETPGPARSPSASGDADPDSSSTAGAADLDPASIAALPTCDPSQLGVDSAWTDTAAADGKVYGSFKIANTSGSECSVSSAGTVGFSAAGAADPLKINVVQHQSGDVATGLPDPAVEPGAVVLKPAMAYEVQFAWVPTDTCPTVGASPTPTPTADNATGVGTGTGTGAEGVTTQQQADVAPQFLVRDDGGTTSEGSITVTHTPEAGAPSAETTISNACAGTIYRTGILEAS